MSFAFGHIMAQYTFTTNNMNLTQYFKRNPDQILGSFVYSDKYGVPSLRKRSKKGFMLVGVVLSYCDDIYTVKLL